MKGGGTLQTSGQLKSQIQGQIFWLREDSSLTKFNRGSELIEAQHSTFVVEENCSRAPTKEGSEDNFQQRLSCNYQGAEKVRLPNLAQKELILAEIRRVSS